jgi:hypothetical protein
MVGIRAIDWLGTATLVGLMTMLLLGLDFGGSTFAWKSPTVIGLLIAGGFLVGCFLLSEWSFAKYPLIPLVIFSQRSNIGCLLIAFFHDFVRSLFLPLLSSFFPHILGMSALIVTS